MDPATGRRKAGWKPSGPERSPFWKKTGPKKGYKRPAGLQKPGIKKGTPKQPHWKKCGRKKGSKDTKPRKKHKSKFSVYSPTAAECSELVPRNQLSIASAVVASSDEHHADSIPQRGLGDLDDVFESLEPFDHTVHKIVEKISDKRPAPTDPSTSRPPPQKVQRIQDLFSSSSPPKEPHQPAQPEEVHRPAQYNEVINSSSPPKEARPTSSANNNNKPARPPGLVASKSPAPEGRKHLFFPGWRPKKADQPAHWKVPGPKKGTKRPAGWVRPETWKKNGKSYRQESHPHPTHAEYALSVFFPFLGPPKGSSQPEDKRPALRLGRQPGAKDKKPRVGGGRQHGAKDKKPRKNSKLLKQQQQSVPKPAGGTSRTGGPEPGPPRRKLGRPPGVKDSKPRKQYPGRQPGITDSRPRQEYAVQGIKPTS